MKKIRINYRYTQHKQSLLGVQNWQDTSILWSLLLYIRLYQETFLLSIQFMEVCYWVWKNIFINIFLLWSLERQFEQLEIILESILFYIFRYTRIIKNHHTWLTKYWQVACSTLKVTAENIKHCCRTDSSLYNFLKCCLFGLVLMNETISEITS